MTLTQITYPSWWERPADIQKVSCTSNPNFPKGFSIPNGKLAIEQLLYHYNIPLVPVTRRGVYHPGHVPLLGVGATHVDTRLFPPGVNVIGYPWTSYLQGDAWYSEDFPVVKNTYSFNEVKTDEMRVAVQNKFLNHVCNNAMGTGNSVWQGAQICALNGEHWESRQQPDGNGQTMSNLLGQSFHDWKISTGFSDRLMAIWQVGVMDSLNNMASNGSNRATFDTIYKTGGTRTAHAQTWHMTQKGVSINIATCYHSIGDTSFMYDYIWNSEISKRINPTMKELWSLWNYDNPLNYITHELHYRYDAGNNIVNNYVGLSTVPDHIFYAQCIIALFLFDGTYTFGGKSDGKGSYNKSDISIDGDGNLQPGANGMYVENLQTHDYNALARYQSSLHADILEANTPWTLPEFAVNAGSLYTGDDRLPANAKVNKLPLVRLKYNAAGTEALVLIWNPSLNSDLANLTQTVRFVDASKSIDETITLYSTEIYIGRFTGI